MASALPVLAAAHPLLAATLPKRIVAIGGSVTEILYALGQQDRIVGRDSTSSYPPAARQKPDIGYMRQLSAEGVLSLHPDLILMEEGAGPPQALSVIAASGLPVVQLPAGHDPAGIARKIRMVADAVGQEAKGAALAQALVQNLDQLQRQLATITPRKRVLFLLSVSGGRAVAAGRDTGGDAIIRLAGGVNVFADVAGYKPISSEAAGALAPDVILMMSHAGPEISDAAILKIPALAITPAARHHALIRMDGLFLLGFGPRTAEAARSLAAKLYPGQGLAPVKAAHP